MVAVATGADSVELLRAAGADVVLPDLRDPGAVADAVTSLAGLALKALARCRQKAEPSGAEEIEAFEIADLVARYGTGGAVLHALTDYIAGRQAYDYDHHGRAGNPSADFVPDSIVDRFCLLGPAPAHIERLRELASIGCDQFAVCLMHDDEDATLDAYGSQIIRR